jgi:hypothetical protein
MYLHEIFEILFFENHPRCFWGLFRTFSNVFGPFLAFFSFFDHYSNGFWNFLIAFSYLGLFSYLGPILSIFEVFMTLRALPDLFWAISLDLTQFYCPLDVFRTILDLFYRFLG